MEASSVSQSSEENTVGRIGNTSEESKVVCGCQEPGSEGEPEQWIMVDKNKDNCLFRKEIREICDSFYCSDIALYIYLLVGLLKEDEIHEQNHSVIIRYVGNMLQRGNVRLGDRHVLNSVQGLVDCVMPGREQLLNSIYRYIVFEFAIWGFSELDVRIGHLQYISTLIKDNPSRFREHFGVKFILDVIRLYYNGNGGLLSNNNDTYRYDTVQLTKIEIKAIRCSLMSEYVAFVLYILVEILLLLLLYYYY